MWFLVLLIFCVPVHAEDIGKLRIYAGSSEPEGYASWKTKIHVLVTDPLGRKTGLNPFVEVQSDYTAGTNYSVESIDDAESGSSGPEYIELEIMQAVGGEYVVSVFGIDNASYSLEIRGYSAFGSEREDILSFSGYISSGTAGSYVMQFNPAPGAPAPVITKIVIFDVLRGDISVAHKLGQLGDDKFAESLIKNIDLAEKLSGVCDRRKAKKDNCEPAIAVLKLFIKRLELANRKCDNPADCDEEREWAAFRKEHGKNTDYRDFFRDLDRDDWHKHKKSSKRFVTDEALKIISEDAGWLIKSLGGSVEDNRGKGKKV